MQTATQAHIELLSSGPRTIADHWGPAWLRPPRSKVEQLVDLEPVALAPPDGQTIEPTLRPAIQSHSCVDCTDEENDRNWSRLTARDFAYLTAPRCYPAPCPWCGGRTRHNPHCDALQASWERTMPFGRHKGKRLSAVPLEYLEWLTTKGSLDTELVEAIEERLRFVGDDAVPEANRPAPKK